MDDMNRAGAAVMDPQFTDFTAEPYPDAPPPQEDVDDFLRKKRKAREHKACYPCRQRKVKCDLTRPCQTCRDREHPELCSYHPPNKRQVVDPGLAPVQGNETASNGAFVTLGRGEFDFLCRKLNTLENSIADLRREMQRNGPIQSSFNAVNTSDGANIDPAVQGFPALQNHSRNFSHTDVHGVHMRNVDGETIHVGSASIPAMLYALQVDQGKTEQHQIQEMLGKNVLPLFGLDNETATYPFVDLWGLPHGSAARAAELARALPGDTQILNLFRHYKAMSYVVYAGIVSAEDMENRLTEFLITRASQSGEEGVNERQIYGKSYTWLALLFAVLASGAQNGDMPRTERELTSQVYVCCSFECLRFTNFLSLANLESIQTLLVIGNVLMNNLNAGTAWSLLGLTIRLAQGLGIHRPCPPGTETGLSYARSKIWWSIIWQDSLLSITYDRSSAAGALEATTVPKPQHFGFVEPYHAVMYDLSKVGMGIVRDRARSMSVQEQITRITEHRDALSNVMRDAAEYLRDSRTCTTRRETIEHWALYLHSSFHMSELCRPALNPNADPELAKAFKETCVDNLVNTVEAFLGLNNITICARQSWASLHRALGSALLLGIIGEYSRNERALRLAERFVDVMADITTNIDPQEISAPIQRGLSALRKLSTPDGGAQDKDVKEMLNINQASMVTPPESDTLEKDSPYTVLNTILWGNTAGLIS